MRIRNFLVACLVLCQFSWASSPVEDVSPPPVAKTSAVPDDLWVLSIEGGGIRGLMAAYWIQQLEEQVGVPASTMFDVFGGTSTGSLLVLGLNTPDAVGKPRFSGKTMVQLYQEKAATIFARPWGHFVSSVAGFVGSKYPATGLKEVLMGAVGAAQLSETIKPCVVPSYDLTHNAPVLFSSSEAKINPDADYLVRKVAQASCAAPLYFPPTHFKLDERGKASLVDGFFWAMNPARLALREAKRLNPKKVGQIHLVSFGTGESHRAPMHEQLKGLSMTAWISRILYGVTDGARQEVHMALDEELNVPGAQRRYFHFQPTIDFAHQNMDNATPENMTYLLGIAQQMVTTDAFKELVILLKMRFATPATQARPV